MLARVANAMLDARRRRYSSLWPRARAGAIDGVAALLTGLVAPDTVRQAMRCARGGVASRPPLSAARMHWPSARPLELGPAPSTASQRSSPDWSAS